LVTAAPASVNTTPKMVPTRNFFAPLRTASMDTEASNTEESPQEEATPGKIGRPPPSDNCQSTCCSCKSSLRV
jgi:hypothetical protein